MDRFDRATRSRVMSRNKSYGTRATEWRFRSLLMHAGISGWRIGHDSGLPGKPDFIFPRIRLAIFLDGCFWHGCRRCRSIPVTNRTFWANKIKTNRTRDRRVDKSLRALGWSVTRIWEHDLKKNRPGILRGVIEKVRSRRKAGAPRRKSDQRRADAL